MEIIQARSAKDFDHARKLFRAYATTIGGHLCFQAFERELDEIGAMYGPPDGCLLLARMDNITAGCVGLRRFGEATCEMKRLYVRPAYRGTGAGRRLVEAALEQAQGMGYRTIRLDTLETMTAAQALYRSLGFRERTPRTESGSEQSLHMEMDLAPTRGHAAPVPGLAGA